MGALGAAVGGRDPYAAFGRGWRGEIQSPGRDLMANLGMDPEATPTKIAGFAADVLNPLDPLNYLGIGGLTKAGKAAKVAGKLDDAAGLAKGFSAQTRAGQRGLLNFAGYRIPLPFDAQAMGGVERGINAVKDSGFGRGVQTMFGGKYGPLLATRTAENEDQLRNIIDLDKLSDLPGGVYSRTTDPLIARIDKLSTDESAELTDAIVRIGQGGDLDTIRDGFIRAGTKGAGKRADAFRASEEMQGSLPDFLKPLGETGLGQFATENLGHLPRIAGNLKGSDAEFAAKLFDPIAETLTGPSNNRLNQMLVQGGIEPPSLVTLSDEGYEAWLQHGGGNPAKAREFFTNATREFIEGAPNPAYNPGFVSDFITKHRLSPKEIAVKTGVRYEENAATLFKRLRKEAIDNVKTDALVREFEKSGMAQQFQVGVHDVLDEFGVPAFMKIDQGRFAASPLAIRREDAEFIKRSLDALEPSPATALGGELMQSMVPRYLRGVASEAVSWWKGLAIFGGGTGYFSRNFGTGVHKNNLFGLRMATDMLSGTNYYGRAAGAAYKAARGDMDHIITLPKSGVEVKLDDFMGQYWGRNMSGGGLPDVDLIEGADLAKDISPAKAFSAKYRTKAFKPMHKINEQVEMLIRSPLALKTLDDTFEQAARMGMDPHSPDVMEAAFKFAAEEVQKAHFDYTDLAPFEKRLRDSGMIPFWTWMRKNIPSESINMVTQPGKYMPYVRGYVSALRGAGLTPENLPEWMQQNFALPLEGMGIPQGEGDRDQVLDLTGFLPFMDVVEIVSAMNPKVGESSIPQEMTRYVVTRSNPYLQQLYEQAAGKNIFMRRNFGVDTPDTLGPFTVSAPVTNLANMARPIRELDRLNPTAGGFAGGLLGAGAGALKGGAPGAVMGASLGVLAGEAASPDDIGLITRAGKALGTFDGDVRPHRNEADPLARATRMTLGFKTYGVDPDQANISKTERKRKVSEYKRKARRARSQGYTSEANFYTKLADSLGAQ